MMKQKQWKFWNNSSLHVNRQMGSFAVLTHRLQPHANPPSCIAAINAKNKGRD